MSCFWVGILSALNISHSPDYITTFIKYLKNNNKLTTDIVWNNVHLPLQLLTENYQAITELKEHDIHNGYLCSTCDPVLLLVCDLFNVEIHHVYNGHIQIYKNTRNVSKILKFQNDTGHFWKTC